MRNARLGIRPTGSIGAMVSGVDLTEPLDDDVHAEMRRALHDHGVLFFRDQAITSEQHVALGKRFGAVHANKSLPKVAGHPLIVEVRREADEKHNHGGAWHVDEGWAEVPPLGSILVARVIPGGGGDTMFANMYRAYETLSDGLKKTLHGLRASNSIKKRISIQGEAEEKRRIAPQDTDRQSTMPVVVRHPDSGRKMLWMNPRHTTHFEGWSVGESEPLLDLLYDHATRPENVYRFVWEPGSIAFWDNRAVWHYAVQDYDGFLRVMHRVSIEGTPFRPVEAP